ncbi:DUF4386 family protein [Microbacterium sp. AGC85]
MSRSSARSATLVAGVGLALMAVIAPIAVFVAIPAGLTGLAALVVLTAAILDVVVALALLPVFSGRAQTLGHITAGLRVAYAAVFAVAGANLLGRADVDAFERIWDAGLLLFAAHLIALSALIWRSEVVGRWLSVLVLIAGLGYLVDAVIVAVAPGLGVEVGSVTFVGEVALLLWLLIRGGRPRRNRGADLLTADAVAAEQSA